MKKIIIGIITLILVWILSFYLTKTNNLEIVDSKIDIVKNNINLWEIPMDEWKVEIPFEFINNWNEDIILWNADTSCMCTDWYVTDEWGLYKSSIIKMNWDWELVNLNKIIKAWEKLKLIAIFDPNAHWPDATWIISRDVFIKTNSMTTPELDFKFTWNVVKTRIKTNSNNIDSEQISKELFSFEEKSFDFWVIKQSWWKVEHNFKFTYNGDDDIKITWVPTSCACTSATIDKTEFKKWDTWSLKVVFNPNLHAEPEWKFFKSVNILTNKNIEEIPEVKIWVQIDLDLWEDAFELKEEHID